MRPTPARLDRPFLADGGLETTLVFREGIDLPCFAAFPLLLDEEGRGALTRYYRPYLALARRWRAGFVLDAPTWRANPDWGAALGYDSEALAAVNVAAIRFVAELAAAQADPETPILLNGVVGPRGDGYRAGAAMTPGEARRYHEPQIRAFARAGADMVSAMTMTSAAEAIGVALAAEGSGLPAVLSFTVETDGRLPSGESLGAAIIETDRATGEFPAFYMLNCAHPLHVEPALPAEAAWLGRIGGLRCNASEKSHAELDAATELDAGDPVALAKDVARLTSRLARLRVYGGCCGTDCRHVAAICDACL